MEKVRVFVVAGEPSGDAIGGRLIGAMKRVWPVPLHFSGIGGCFMEREGIKSLFRMEDIAVMGVTELIPHLLTVSNRLNQAVKAVADFKPDVVVTVDSKGFSFRLLKRVKEIYAASGQPAPLCVHYVAPSFWAWKGGEEKLRKLAHVVDHLLCILPFEEDVCKRNGLAATFVGHPVLEDSFDLNDEARQARLTPFKVPLGLSMGTGKASAAIMACPVPFQFSPSFQEAGCKSLKKCYQFTAPL